MCWRCSSSICSVLLWMWLGACSGSDSGNGDSAGAPAAGSGGDTAQEPDGGSSYRGDAGEQDRDAGARAGSSAGAAAGSGGSTAGASSAGRGGAGGAAASGEELDVSAVQSADCRPDPTDFAACGGEIAGKWRVASICIDADVADLRERLMCNKVEQEFSYDYRMLVDFQSSGDYSAVVQAEAIHSATLPFSCLRDNADCRELLGEDDTDDSDGSTLVITMDAEGCVVEARERETRTAEGTWKTSGNELTMTDATGPDTSEYCVTGNTLLVRNVNEATNEVSWGVFERL